VTADAGAMAVNTAAALSARTPAAAASRLVSVRDM
jgi:hypothetical protein